jgi:hypothetical protein
MNQSEAAFYSHLLDANGTDFKAATSSPHQTWRNLGENLSKIASSTPHFWKCIPTSHFLETGGQQKCLLIICEHSYS